MKTFKEYTSNPERQNAKQGTEQAQGAQTADAEQLTRRIAAAYNGKSNADMWRSIAAEAERSRRAGTLTDEDIDAFYQTFSPMLDTYQRKRLQAIVEKLKKM